MITVKDRNFFAPTNDRNRARGHWPPLKGDGAITRRLDWLVRGFINLIELDIDAMNLLRIFVCQPPQKGAKQFPFLPWLLRTKYLTVNGAGCRWPIHPSWIIRVSMRYLLSPFLDEKSLQFPCRHCLLELLVEFRSFLLNYLKTNHNSSFYLPVKLIFWSGGDFHF